MRRLATALALATAFALVAGSPAAQAEFGFSSFDVDYTDSLGAPATLAGSHPGAQLTAFEFNTTEHPALGTIPDQRVKDQVFSQIAGLVGDPTALPACSAADFAANACGGSTVGEAIVQIVTLEDDPVPTSVSLLQPPPGAAAMLGFQVVGVPIAIELSVNPAPPHNVIARTRNTSQIVPFFGAAVEILGNPPDAAGRPFLTLPRACEGPLRTDYAINSWTAPADLRQGFAETPAFTGCQALGFDPQASAAPSTDVAESPSGFDFTIDVADPGLADPDGRAKSDLKRAVVTLPEGMSVNPAAAGGLAACAQAQLAGETYDSASGEGCPEASKVATVAVETPLLDERLSGSVFLATPYENPLGELLAGYLVIKQPERGIIVKLPGKIEADPNTGQLVSSFDQNPQLPFDHLEVSFTPGPRAPLITPQTCGDYEVRTELYPWSGNAPDVSTQPFAIAAAPGGGPCPTTPAALPHAPGFDAGTVSPISKTHSPFVVNLRREDGSQRFSAVTLNPPQGLVAKLAGTATCSDGALAEAAAKSGKAEQATPSCPAASEVGSVFAAAGAGPAPYHAPAKAYLTGPYKSAPLSLAVIAPAVAGPFDLGTVVVRSALYVNPKSAEITAVSDPLPEILAGIPLDVRSVSIRLDKPDFTLNGTSCDPLAITGALTSTLGAIAQLSNRFQLSDCTRLAFKPRMTLKLRGGTRRGKHPALTIALTPRAGDANIASVSVALPRSEFLENAHIRTVCTRPDFAADNCPAGAVYGTATVDTPLLDYDLSGNVYLRSSDNLLPDVVPDLRGPAYQPIKLETSGRTDSVKGGIRTTIDFVPDAPFTKAVVALQGGSKGLLVNSRDICARTYRATVRYTAHNGLTHTARPALKARCGKKGKKRKGKRGGHGRKRLAQRGAVG